MPAAPFGARYWSDPDTYYCQDNNPTEHLLRVRSLNGRGWLETCGPTAAVNCLAALGRPVASATPGGYAPPPEQVLCDFFHDENQFRFLKAQWSGLDPMAVAGNEVAQWYPGAVEKVFAAQAEFVGALGFDQVVDRLSRGQALQLCLVNPGHFVAVVAYSPAEGALIINDPWAGRWPDGSGWNKRMTKAEFETNTKPVAVAYA